MVREGGEDGAFYYGGCYRIVHPWENYLLMKANKLGFGN